MASLHNRRNPIRRVFHAFILCLLTAFLALRIRAEERATSVVVPRLQWRSQIESDWLRQDKVRSLGPQEPVTTQEDALGACDGFKDGKWGIHTQAEPNPWWQVDMGATYRLGKVLVYNRCDCCSERTARMSLLLSQDGRAWKEMYRHDGTVFYGKTDGKPLCITLNGEAARFVRVQLADTNFLHLDEVEVYGSDDPQTNLALWKTADQSSTSQWSSRKIRPGERVAPVLPIAQVIERGRKLLECLKAMGVYVNECEQILGEVDSSSREVANSNDWETKRSLYCKARWAIRKMALSNPLLNFDTLLFVKSAPGALPHMSDQFYGWFSRPGGGIFLLTGFKGDSPRLRCLTSGFREGSFYPRPDISFDGKKILFSYCRHYPDLLYQVKVQKDKLPEDCFYHVYEMNIDGSGCRQLTRGHYDDFDARYLPNGEIVFLSTRKGQFLQSGKASARATQQAICPDSFVRCGGGSTRPVAVFTLHVMDAQGGNLRAISAFENFEWTPMVGSDGRILYARWDYIDRPNGHFISLWATNPDGTHPQLVYGNYTVRPQCVFEAQPIPNSNKLVFTASAHHSITGGSLCLLDIGRGMEGLRPITRLTPEVCFPETEGWPSHYFANPFPLSEQFYLVAWSDRALPPHFIVLDERNPCNPSGIYLYDLFGNLELLYRDPTLSCMHPMPVRSRRKPPVIPSSVQWDGPQEGRFLLQDVYRGLTDIARGTIRFLRVIGVPPKVQPEMNSPVLGVSSEEPGKYLLGTVPVEEDGSAFFRVPSGVPVFFQALDASGVAVQTMRSLVYVQPGQTLSCIGCHESRATAPPASRRPLALVRKPSRLKPGPPGTWPLRFDELVQPILNKHCTRCHHPGSRDVKAAHVDLTPARSWISLVTFGNEDLKKLAWEKDRSIPGKSPAANSKLLAMLRQGHHNVRLEKEDFDRLIVWMDLYAQRQGSFSEEQEHKLKQFRRQVANMLEGSDNNP